MQSVPGRKFALMATSTGVVVAEPVDHVIPERSEHLNQHALAQRNPDVVHHQRTEPEILYRQGVVRLPDRFGVFLQPCPQRLATRGIKLGKSFSRARRDGLPHVDWLLKFPADIAGAQPMVGLETTGVVQRVDPCALDRPDRRQRLGLSGQQRFADAARQVRFVEWVVDCRHCPPSSVAHARSSQ